MSKRLDHIFRDLAEPTTDELHVSIRAKIAVYLFLATVAIGLAQLGLIAIGVWLNP